MQSKRELLRVVKDCFVVFDYALYDADGDLVEDTEDEGASPVRCVHGYGMLVPGLEKGLIGLAAGETREISVESFEAYGSWDAAKEQWVDRADFPPGVAVEDEFEALDADGDEITLRVVELTDDAVLVDGNHPLAGETLRFDVIVREVRPATDEELAVARAEAPKPRLRVVSAGEPAAGNGGRGRVSDRAGVTEPSRSARRKGGKPKPKPRSPSQSKAPPARSPTVPGFDDDEQ